MAKFQKVVAALPASIDADTTYYVRVGDGFDMYVSTLDGSIAHKLNEHKLNNSGQIKINWDAASRPATGAGVSNGVPISIPLNSNYTVSSSPTTTAPVLSTSANIGDDLIDPDTLLIRELLEGQSMMLRIKFGYTGKAANQTGAITVRLSNPNPASSFNEPISLPVLDGATSHEETVIMTMISDSLSIDPLYGYEFSAEALFNDNNLEIYISSITAHYIPVENFLVD